VPVDDLNDPRISAYKPQRRILLPAPPGPRPKRSKAERQRAARAEARADARAARFHLVGLTDAGVVIMGLVLAAAVVVLIAVVMSHH
jgi:hypothetical protein